MPATRLSRFRWLAGIYASLIILTICLADDGRYQFIFAWIRGIPGGDKVGHFCLIGGLAFVINLASGLRQFTCWGRAWLWGGTAVFVVVLLEEISQAWIPTRTFDLLDLTFDVLGIVCFGWLAKRLGARTTSPQQSSHT